MKTKSTKNHGLKQRDDSGVALVIVLSMIVLLSALMVAFMSRVSTENRSAKLSLQGIEARQAAESAVNLVISQLRSATYDSGGSWASQPGLIRVFGDGKDGDIFKLYSSDTMRESAKDYSAKVGSKEESGVDPSDLSSTPPGFVNLNAPIYIPRVGAKDQYEAYFPICDPRAQYRVDGQPNTSGEDGAIKGFHCAQVKQTAKNPRRDSNNNEIPELPMNVKWLYQLRDGQLVAPTPIDKDGEKMTILGASAANPPIARIAFWTDDESAKLNINTAGENTYWDTPHVSTVQEAGRINTDGSLNFNESRPDDFLALGAAQPTASEYQRFPGHPATTCLSPALRWLFPDVASGGAKPHYTESQFKEAIYRLAPRLDQGLGTSMGGTRNPVYPKVDHRTFTKDRLFATVDDYFFRPDRSPLTEVSYYKAFQTVDAAEDGAPSADIANSHFKPEAIQRLRFFLTASSRAPELNLFGLPRMSIWPLHADSAKRSGFDELIQFCSTVGTQPFYFQRNNPWSATEDMKLNGARNLALYNYILSLLSQNNPAAGGKFSEKYPSGGMNQILTTMFDYIRCTNLIDTHNGDELKNQFPLAYTPHYGSYGRDNNKPNQGSGQVTPLQIGDTKGFGRFPTVSEVALIFYLDDTITSQGALDAGQLLTEDEKWEGTAAEINTKVPMRCALALEMFTPSPGYPALSENYAYSVKELTPFMVEVESDTAPPGPVPLNLTGLNGAVNYVEVDAWRGWEGRFFMPTRGFSNQFVYDNGNTRAPKKLARGTGITGLDYSSYPFISKRFVMANQNKEKPKYFRLQPGKLEIKIYPILRPNTYPLPDTKLDFIADFDNPVQTITVNFAINGNSAFKLPVPEKIDLRSGGKDKDNVTDTIEQKYTTLQQRMASNTVRVMPGDTVRSMEVNGFAKGDYRMVAALRKVPENLFARTGKANSSNYTNQDVRQVHNLRSSWGKFIPSGDIWKFDTAKIVNYGNLVNKIAYRWDGTRQNADKIPKVPADITNGVVRPDGGLGDFDRGLSKHTDGAYINKPDEGNTRFKLDDDYSGGGAIPYYRGSNGYEEVGESFFSPNRMIASAVMFGSLPTGVISKRPWETLLFRPPPQVPSKHRGSAAAPMDHYLLDFFHMPVVEPYAISEPLSTAGKVNINCMLAPFSYANDPADTQKGYIDRYTGIHGLLKGMYQLAVPNDAPNTAHNESPLSNSRNYRFKIDPEATIKKSFAPNLKKKGYFRSASEICEVDFLTTSEGKFTDPSQRDAFWETTNGLTGDNQRERPYAHVYPRTTTKSNVFTVHVWAQSLAKSPSGPADTWDESRDSVTGEYRGATTIERYVDPKDSALFKAPYDDLTTNKKSLEPLYRYRIVNNKAFVVRQ